MKLKPGDEVVGLDGRTYVVVRSLLSVLGLDGRRCNECDLRIAVMGVMYACKWVGKNYRCVDYTKGKLCFKLKE